VKQRILNPLGMTSSTFDVAELLPARLAWRALATAQPRRAGAQRSPWTGLAWVRPHEALQGPPAPYQIAVGSGANLRKLLDKPPRMSGLAEKTAFGRQEEVPREPLTPAILGPRCAGARIVVPRTSAPSRQPPPRRLPCPLRCSL
jgi:CubicO group peptidase (beta-lactamase class C family)